MVAAPYTGTMIFQGSSSGKANYVPFTASDVANEYAIFPDGNGFLQLDSNENWTLRDIIVVTGGTDTKRLAVYKNGLTTGIEIFAAANLTTTIGRQFQQLPPTFAAGAMLRFKQTA